MTAPALAQPRTRPTCHVVACTRKVDAKEKCGPHYHQWRRGTLNEAIEQPPAARRDLTWLLFAACVDEDPELFFPVGTSGPAVEQTADAKTVCRRCPVVTECLAWALATGQDHGVWGGLAENERRALKRRGGGA